MGDLFSSGGVFMMPMAFLGIVMIALAARVLLASFTNEGDGTGDGDLGKTNLVVLQIGVFVFFLGILSQALGAIQALQMIQQAGSVSPNIVAGGIRVTLIAPSFGLIILLISWVFWSIARYRINDLA